MKIQIKRKQNMLIKISSIIYQAILMQTQILMIDAVGLVNCNNLMIVKVQMDEKFQINKIALKLLDTMQAMINIKELNPCAA